MGNNHFFKPGTRVRFKGKLYKLLSRVTKQVWKAQPVSDEKAVVKIDVGEIESVTSW